MAAKNQPLDTLCRRALRKGAPAATAWLRAHPDASGVESLREQLARLEEAGAEVVHVDEADDEPPRVRTLIVGLPAAKGRADAVVRAVAAIERGLRRRDAGADLGNHFAVLRCLPD